MNFSPGDLLIAIIVTLMVLCFAAGGVDLLNWRIAQLSNDCDCGWADCMYCGAKPPPKK